MPNFEPGQLYILEDRPEVIADAIKDTHLIVYETMEVTLGTAHIDALRSGKVLFLGVGAMGTLEYPLIIRLEDSARA